MSLVITSPEDYLPAYNPILVTAVSTVRDDFTTGSALAIESVTSYLGYCQIEFVADHGLLKGDYVLVTSAPGISAMIGVALVTKVIDNDTLVINRPFTTGLTSNGIVYKYINNYSMLVKFYIYVTAASTIPILKASKILKPYFSGGFCNFQCDLSNLIKSYNFADDEPDDVLSSDLIPFNLSTYQVDNKSFVKYGFECFEAYDNPTGGVPVFIDDIPL